MVSIIERLDKLDEYRLHNPIVIWKKAHCYKKQNVA